MLKDKIFNLRKLIEKEKRYAWMLIFVVLVHSVSIIANPVVPKKAGAKKAYQIQQELLKADPQKRHEVMQKALREKPQVIYMMGILTLFFFMGIFFGMILLIRFMAQTLTGQRPIPRTLDASPIQWGMAEVIKAVIIFMFLGVLFSIFEVVLLGVLHLRQRDRRLDMILQSTLGDILGFLLVLYFVTVKSREKIVALGLSAKRFFTNIYVGGAGYLAFLPVLAGLFLLVLWVTKAAKYEPPPEPIIELFFEETRSRLLMILTVLVVLIGPAIEEVFFRGFLYNAIKKRWGMVLAILLSAAAFSALHTNIVGFLPIMALGVLLAYLYEQSGSLVPSITVHILHNSLLTLLMFSSKTIMGLG